MELSPSRQLSVVVYDDAHGQKSLDIAKSWTDSGLLRESVWVSAKQAGIDGGGPPSINGRLVAKGSPADEEDLFTLIGVRRLNLVRVVALQIITASDHGASEVIATSKYIAEAVRQVLPRDIAQHGKGTGLARINLIVPESRAAQIGTDRIQPAWEVNAIASPEDRPDLDQSSIFVREDLNLYAHATAAVAAIGGLWPGMDAGAFDSHETDSSTGESDLVVFRPSVRLLLGDEPAEALSNMAMEMVQPESGQGASARVAWGARAEAPGQTALLAARELQAHGEWGRDLLREMNPMVKPQLSFKSAFGDFLRFQGRLLLSAGRVVRNRATRLAEDAVTNVLIGKDGDSVVRFSPDNPTDIVATAQLVLENYSQQLRADYLDREIEKSAPPPPETWSDLRQLSFGLVDGSKLPPGFSVPQRAGTREAMPPSAIVPHPADVFTLPNGEKVAPLDLPGVAAAIVQLTPKEEDELETTSEAEPDCDEAPPSEVPSIDEPTALEDFQKWLDRHRGSLFWETAHLTDARRRRARDVERDSLAKATETSVPDAKLVFKARVRLILLWTLIVLVWLFAGLRALYIYKFGDGFNDTKTIQATVSLVVGSFLVAFYGGWRYYRALRRFEWSVRTCLAERHHAADSYVVAGREAERLALLNEGVKDWAQAIGWLAHAPWKVDEHDTSQSLIDPDELPASVALAALDSAHDSMPPALIEACVQQLCPQGWTTHLFDQFVARMADSDSTAGVDRGYLSADLDGGVSNRSARDLLNEFIASDEARSEMAHQTRDKVQRLIDERVLVIPARRVRRLGRFAPPVPIADDEFFAGALGPQTPFVEEIWTDVGMVTRRHIVSESSAWLPPMRSAPVERIDVRRSSADSGIRVDYSPTCQPSDVRIFGAPRPSADVSVGGLGDDWN